MAGYNLIVKAETLDDAKGHTQDWLSIPGRDIIGAASLGYDEVMVSVTSTERDLTADLNHWLNGTIPRDGQPFEDGALIWWKS